jgi:hypothetical protein
LPHSCNGSFPDDSSMSNSVATHEENGLGKEK